MLRRALMDFEFQSIRAWRSPEIEAPLATDDEDSEMVLTSAFVRTLWML